MATATVTILAGILVELKSQTKLLRQIAGRCDHRWTGPDMDNPIRCTKCGEKY